jgi:CheY-like chemotaxis protein
MKEHERRQMTPVFTQTEHQGGRAMTAGQGGSRGVVLVVDDDPDVRGTIVSLLEPEGFTVIEAASGREALNILEYDPTVQILFTDVLMPGISGITLAKRALERRPDLRIILASAYMRDEEDALPCLKKPFRGDELLRALSGTLRV